MRRFFVVSVLSVLVVSLMPGGAALAHEMLLYPSSMTAAKGETVRIELHATHYFVVPEIMEDVSLLTGGVFRNGALEESEFRANEPELRVDFDVKIEDDGAVLVVAVSDGAIRSVTNEGTMVGRTRRELEDRNLRVLSASKTDRYVKAILNASGGDTNFATQVGQALEFVPITNPADAKVGEFFEVKVLLDGQPAAIPVWATYDGFELDIEDTFAYDTVSDSDGVAKIKITAPGIWFVRTELDDEPGVEGEYDVLNLASILTFEVR